MARRVIAAALSFLLVESSISQAWAAVAVKTAPMGRPASAAHMSLGAVAIPYSAAMKLPERTANLGLPNSLPVLNGPKLSASDSPLTGTSVSAAPNGSVPAQAAAAQAAAAVSPSFSPLAQASPLSAQSGPGGGGARHTAASAGDAVMSPSNLIHAAYTAQRAHNSVRSSSMDLRKGWGAFWDGARGLSGAAPGVLAFAANEPISGRSPRLRPASWLHSAASAIPEPPIFSGEGKSPEEQKPHKSRFGPLWAQILGALVLGSFTGYLLAPGMGLVSAPATANILSWLVVPSDIFLSFLKMVAGPLVFASIVQAIGTHEDSGQLKSLSWKVLLYYTFTSLVATTIGAAVAFLVQPGSYFDGTAGGVVPAIAQTTLPGFGEFLRNLVPKSPISPFIDGNMLQIVLLGVLTGAAFLGLKEKAKAALEVVGSVRSLAMTLVRWSMYLAPLAVFGLMAKVVSTTGVQALVGMGVYMGTVVLGLAVMIGFYSLLIKFVGKLSPLKFFKHSKEAILTGFSTASSATAMPISMDTAQNKLGVSPAVSKLLISLGAAVNMEGTALYQVVATIFLAQVFGIPLSLGALALIIGITLASSLGTPGTPGAGIVILATVLTSVGIPLEGIALILGVDRILDMCRTAINVVGDLTSAVVMDAVAKKR